MLTTEKYELLVGALIDCIKEKDFKLYLNDITIKDLEEKLNNAEELLRGEDECLQKDNPHY
jgi:hypothetical protein